MPADARDPDRIVRLVQARWRRHAVVAGTAVTIVLAGGVLAAATVTDDDTTVEALDDGPSTTTPVPATTTGPAPATSAPTTLPATTTTTEVVDHGVPLWGKRFQVEAASVQGEPYQFTGTMWVEFRREETRDVVVWSGGCNTAGSDVEVMADRLVLGEISATAAGCAQRPMDQDDWLTALLTADPDWSLHRATLTLQGDGRKITARAAGETHS